MTAKVPFQQLLIFSFLILTAGVPQVLAEAGGELCNDTLPTGWASGGAPVRHDDECNFSVDFNAGLDPLSWVRRPTFTFSRTVEVYSFEIGAELLDLLPATEFRFFDLISDKAALFQLVLGMGDQGFELSGLWNDGDWQKLTPANVAFDASAARGISLVVARSSVQKADLVVYVDGTEVMSARDVVFLDVPSEVRLGVITDPGPGALGSFSFYPSF